MHFFVAFHINCEEKIDNVTLCILNIGGTAHNAYDNQK